MPKKKVEYEVPQEMFEIDEDGNIKIKAELLDDEIKERLKLDTPDFQALRLRVTALL